MSIPNPDIIDDKVDAPASISHELRTPLTSIIGYAEIMLSDPKLSHKARQEYVQIIRDEGKRLSSFIDDYLGTKSRSKDRALTTFPKEDVSTLVMSTVAMVRSKAEAKSINIISSLEPVALPSRLDPLMITQLTENLLVNAIKFSSTESQIHVDVSRDFPSIQIQIRSELKQSQDTNAEALFDDFTWTYAANLEIREQGLGLAFAKQLVELQRGSLTVTTNEEHILTMTLEFPNR
ncbi:MAG: HAMP domain-containing histidine kinase [Ignavibacteriales bacterium]|nr:HAMP domain-containing histidine kinase [Ignavibacteriales bacterium]